MMKETLSFYWIFGTLVKTLLLACQAKSRQPSSCCLHIRVECRLKCKFLVENEMLSVTLQPDIFKLMIDHQFGITSRRSFLILSSVIICLKSWITNIEVRADIGAYGLFVSWINKFFFFGHSQIHQQIVCSCVHWRVFPHNCYNNGVSHNTWKNDQRVNHRKNDVRCG